MNNVILVDKDDNSVGTMDKMKAHEMGVLHRAFSIFLFNDKGELLLQKRQESKYHSAGLWTNTCCSHPKPGEKLIDGAKSRLMEEMGISTEIEFAFSFVYKAEFDNGLTENEFDHVFIGSYSDKPAINEEEVSDWRYASLEKIKEEINQFPRIYTEWFKIALPLFEKYLLENRK